MSKNFANRYPFSWCVEEFTNWKNRGAQLPSTRNAGRGMLTVLSFYSGRASLLTNGR